MDSIVNKILKENSHRGKETTIKGIVILKYPHKLNSIKIV